MDIKEIYALVDYLVEEKLNQINLPQGKKGLRGPIGRDGKDGESLSWEDHKEEILNRVDSNKLTFQDLSEENKENIRGEKGPRGQKGSTGIRGQDGKSFDWDEHVEEISKLISSNKLKFSDLSEEDKKSLIGARGSRGQKGKSGEDGLDGKSFVWNDHEEKIYNRIDSNKLTFSKLTEDEIESLRGPIGLRGKSGSHGRDFIWEDHEEKIYNRIDSNKLTFSKLTEEEVNSLKGPRGLRGQKGKHGENGLDGKDFSWDDHSKEILSRVDANKLKFSDFTDEEVKSITGPKGSRGQKGKSGANGLSAYEIWQKTNDGSEKDYIRSLVGKNGVPGIQGVQGVQGLTGQRGRDGLDGIHGANATEIIDIQLKEENQRFYFVFIFSDGSNIETRSIDKPAVERIIQSTTYYGGSGGSGGGASVLEVYKDNILAGLSKSLNFIGDNIIVAYDELTEQSTISVTEKDDLCIPVLDEGNVITDCLKSIDFCGAGVTVTSSTMMGDWATLSEVTTLSGYEAVNPGATKVTITSGETAAKLSLTRSASEAIAKFDLVRLINSTEVAKGSSDTINEAKISGIAINDAAIGEDVTFIMFGILEDLSFNYTLLAKLFLQSDGSLGETPPSAVGEFVVVSAQSLGLGAVFIKIEEPEGIS